MARGPTTLESLPPSRSSGSSEVPPRPRRVVRHTPPDAAEYLCSAARRLARSLELTDTLRCMGDLCVPDLGSAYILYLFRDGPASLEVSSVKHMDPVRGQLLETLAQRALSDSARRKPLLHVASTRRPAVLSQLKTAELIGDGRPAHVLQSDLRLKTAVLVPVSDGQHVLGVAVCFAESTRYYSTRQVHLVRELCDLFALAVTGARTYQTSTAALDATREMLATTIHDLMSPLTFIKASAQQLRRLDWDKIDPLTTAELDKRLTAIDAAVTRMAAAMTTLMETTRPCLSAVSRTRSIETTDLVGLVRETAGAEQLIAPDHVIRVVQDGRDALTGAWDGGQIRRMLTNLIGNAVKYSPPGSPVDIQLAHDVDDEGRWAVVRISDQGIGIPACDLPFMFEPFHRGSNVGDVPGTGLGLASVWQIVRTHMGRLWVDSREGKSTTITVRLPLA